MSIGFNWNRIGGYYLDSSKPAKSFNSMLAVCELDCQFESIIGYEPPLTNHQSTGGATIRLQRLSHCHELGPLQSHSEIAEWSYIKNCTDLFYQAKKSVTGIQNSAHSQIRCNS